MRFLPSDLAIRRPASVYIFIFILVIMGFSAYEALPRESAPDVQIPLLIVTIPYPGASPEDVEALITHKVENELQGLDNLKKLKSTSTEGAAMITLEFHLGFDIDDARTKTREGLDKVMPELPSDAEDAIISEVNLSERPILIVNLAGKYDLFQLKEIAEDLKDRLEGIPGVLEVKRAGGLEREVQVSVDPEKLNYYSLDLNQVSNTISNENKTIPAGDLTLGSMKYMIRVPGEIEQPDEIREMVVSAPNQVPIYIKDVAQVRFGFKEVTSRSRLNGMDSVSLSVSKKSGENIIFIADRVREIIAEEQERQGDSLQFTILNDESKRIRSMVSDLENNIYTGLIFVVGSLMLVMGLATSLFIGVAIPISMLLSFIVLSWAGITLNFVVLFSLMLALGMLVDNAIVVVENIYRHMEQGLTPIEAAQVGVGEVAVPVITSTLTTLAAFMPLLFMPGIAGDFMSYLPKTLIITLTASLFVGLILNPVFCSTLMRSHGTHHEATPDEMAAKSRILKVYRKSLEWALDNRWKVMGIVVVAWIAMAGIYFALVLPKAGVEFFPSSEPGSATLHVEAPFGSTLETSDHLVQEIEKDLEKYYDHTEAIVANVGQRQGSSGQGGRETHNSHITLSFPDWQERTKQPSEIMNEIRASLDQYSGALLRLTKPQGGPPTGKPINLEISGPDSAQLKRLSLTVQSKIKDLKGLVNLEDDMSATRSEIQVLMDRQKLAQSGLSTSQVANIIRTAFNGREVSTWRVGKDEYDIVVRLDPRYRTNITDIQGLYIKTPAGDSIALSELAEIKTAAAKGSIRHIGLKTVITVSADAEGVPGATLLGQVRDRLEGFELPKGYLINYTGENEAQQEMQSYLGKSFMIAIFLIFLILVTQFNSVYLPFIILSSVFLSLMGVFLGWTLHFSPLSIMMGGIGIISLAGVVVNNAIVLIDYIGQMRAEGRDMREAVVLSGMLRLRPVMMTAVTTILGLIPIVLGMDINFYRPGIVSFGSDSAQMWQPMARSVVYGLAVATLLTLIVVPVIYSLIESFKDASGRAAKQVGRQVAQPMGRLREALPDFSLSGAAERMFNGSQQKTASPRAAADEEPYQSEAPEAEVSASPDPSKTPEPGPPEAPAPGQSTQAGPGKIKLPDWLKRKD
ncbi:MAG: efflux RND transporter permease subunit [bacterium]|nr:efflux RND transporter permease subunit [bacterium]